MLASSLQLRGTGKALVPHQNDHGDCLCFNGELYSGLAVAPESNDGAALLDALSGALGTVPPHSGATSTPSSAPGVALARGAASVRAAFARVMDNLVGPWALVFWHASSGTLFFGRDPLGRRSLLYAQGPGVCVLASTALPRGVSQKAGLPEAFREVPPGLYAVHVPEASPSSPVCTDSGGRGCADASALGLRGVEGVGSFSPAGGADAGVLLTQPIPAVTVHRSALHEERVALIHQARAPGRPRPPVASGGAAEHLLSALRTAVTRRCSAIDVAVPAHRTTWYERLPPDPSHLPPARVAVAFSGGLDSTLLAALAAAALPEHEPVDLVSVCFDGGASPDRAAAREGLTELSTLWPQRRWRLVEVDRTLEDVDTGRERLLELLAPCATVMDLNIGAALYYVARASGVLRLPSTAAPEATEYAGRPFTSRARVMLLGHGADEALGGYGRHRTRFREGGWPALQAELELDMRRLWTRNLGRDDRIVAAASREARHPFLDEAFLTTAATLPLEELTDPTRPPGAGDKAALRAAARAVGLVRAAAQPKRAIQFGSRIGKKSNVRDFGSNRAANARHAGSVRLVDVPLPVAVPGSASAGPQPRACQTTAPA